MKKRFWVSLCYKGAHSGGLYMMDDYMIFKTGKIQLPDEMKIINIQYRNITDISPCSSLLIFPALIIIEKNQTKHKFIIFKRNKFLKNINNIWKPAV